MSTNFQFIKNNRQATNSYLPSIEDLSFKVKHIVEIKCNNEISNFKILKSKIKSSNLTHQEYSDLLNNMYSSEKDFYECSNKVDGGFNTFFDNMRKKKENYNSISHNNLDFSISSFEKERLEQLRKIAWEKINY